MRVCEHGIGASTHDRSVFNSGWSRPIFAEDSGEQSRKVREPEGGSCVRDRRHSTLNRGHRSTGPSRSFAAALNKSSCSCAGAEILLGLAGANSKSDAIRITLRRLDNQARGLARTADGPSVHAYITRERGLYRHLSAGARCSGSGRRHRRTAQDRSRVAFIGFESKTKG